ncbi:MAG: hypothetical protein IJ555_05150 [Ruminococcus sp.]|nr:hypothetical protein [Ruminococcus sp.]
MKKLFASYLAFVLAGAMLAGCGNSDSSSTADTPSEAETTTTTKAEETTTTTTTAETTTTTEAEPEPAGLTYDPNATESVFEFTDDDANLKEWDNPLPCYFDARSFPEDSEMTVTVDFKLSDQLVGSIEADILKGNEQIGIAPNEIADGWHHFAETAGTISADFPIGALLAEMEDYSDGTYFIKPKKNSDGTIKVNKEGKTQFSDDVYLVENTNAIAPIACRPDGIIKYDDSWKEWKKGEIHSFTFTISKEQVQKMRDTGLKSNYEGLLFQSAGNTVITKVTFDVGNILTNKQYAEWKKKAGDSAVWG